MSVIAWGFFFFFFLINIINATGGVFFITRLINELLYDALAQSVFERYG